MFIGWNRKRLWIAPDGKEMAFTQDKVGILWPWGGAFKVKVLRDELSDQYPGWSCWRVSRLLRTASQADHIHDLLLQLKRT